MIAGCVAANNVIRQNPWSKGMFALCTHIVYTGYTRKEQQMDNQLKAILKMVDAQNRLIQVIAVRQGIPDEILESNMNKVADAYALFFTPEGTK